MAGLNSRWRKGNMRYTRDVERYLNSFREASGWHKGARVIKQRKQNG